MIKFDVQKGSVIAKIEMERYGRTSSDSTSSTEHKNLPVQRHTNRHAIRRKTPDLSTNKEVISV